MTAVAKRILKRTRSSTFPEHWTLADLRKHLGGIPASRIRLLPLPGSATEADAIRVNECKDGMLCELIDGVLVEKTVGYFESRIAWWLGHFLQNYLDEHDLGIGLGADGMLRILPKQIRIPDVCFISWDRLPNRKEPEEAVPGLVPDLAIEVLSKGNTKKEMQRKLREYFEAGVKVVWFIDGKKRKATIYTSPTSSTEVQEDQSLDGGELLPGFQFFLRDLFSKAGRHDELAVLAQ